MKKLILGTVLAASTFAGSFAEAKDLRELSVQAKAVILQDIVIPQGSVKYFQHGVEVTSLQKLDVNGVFCNVGVWSFGNSLVHHDSLLKTGERGIVNSSEDVWSDHYKEVLVGFTRQGESGKIRIRCQKHSEWQGGYTYYNLENPTVSDANEALKGVINIFE